MSDKLSLQIATFGLVTAGVILLAITLIIGGKQTTQSRPTKSSKKAAVGVKAGIVSVGNKTPQETAKTNCSEKPNSSNASGHFRDVTKMVVVATAYTDHDAGCRPSRKTRTPSGRHIPGVAVDRKVIPIGAQVHIPGYGWMTADDAGGSAIRGNKIDIRMNKRRECFAFGRRTITIRIKERVR